MRNGNTPPASGGNSEQTLLHRHELKDFRCVNCVYITRIINIWMNITYKNTSPIPLGYNVNCMPNILYDKVHAFHSGELYALAKYVYKTRVILRVTDFHTTPMT